MGRSPPGCSPHSALSHQSSPVNPFTSHQLQGQLQSPLQSMQPMAMNSYNALNGPLEYEKNVIDFDDRQQDAERLSAMLVEAGLLDRADGQERPIETEASQVPLGDSEKTTNPKQFIQEEWGTRGTMYKIYKCIKEGVKPLDVHRLVSRGPTIEGHRRVIAARCFCSILKLKQYGFINVVKDSRTNEIKDISGMPIGVHNATNIEDALTPISPGSSAQLAQQKHQCSKLYSRDSL